MHFLYTKVCKRSCQWQVLCIPKYAIKAASGRFYVSRHAGKPLIRRCSKRIGRKYVIQLELLPDLEYYISDIVLGYVAEVDYEICAGR